MSLQPASPRSASGRPITAMPAPRPLAIASTLIAYARLLRGISSAAATAIRRSSARPIGRPIDCVATSTPKFGARAPRAENNGANQAASTIIRRRPARSAMKAIGRANTMPTRTITPPTPCPNLPMPKSFAAKLAVCVNSVLANAELIEAAASRPSNSACRGSRRSGGAHQGCAPWVLTRPCRPIVRRTGRLNNHPNQGIERP